MLDTTSCASFSFNSSLYKLDLSAFSIKLKVTGVELIRLWPASQVLEREGKGGFYRRPLAFLCRSKPPFPSLSNAYHAG